MPTPLKKLFAVATVVVLAVGLLLLLWATVLFPNFFDPSLDRIVDPEESPVGIVSIVEDDEEQTENCH